MRNHYHLVFDETPEPNLVPGMRRKLAQTRLAKARTTISRGWIAERLHLRSAANVSHYKEAPPAP